jgi:transglutaminase-like putative cysteine protease
MPTLSIRHLTKYRYRRAVSFGEHRMMFRPRESYDQRVLESRLVISPEPVELKHIHDVFGNCVSVARFSGKAKELVFESHVRLIHEPPPVVVDPHDCIDGGSPAYSDDDLPDLASSIQRRFPDPDGRVAAWARRFLRSGGPTELLPLLADMTGAIHGEFKYSRRLEAGVQSPLQTLELGTGTCRDFAVLMIEAVRSLGLAARFVSGYIFTPTDGRRLGGGHTHAWVRAYLPSCGWVEFDPTNGIVGGADLIRVAVARDPNQAVPLHGSWSGSRSDYIDMSVEVDVQIENERKGIRRVA